MHTMDTQKVHLIVLDELNSFISKKKVQIKQIFRFQTFFII